MDSEQRGHPPAAASAEAPYSELIGKLDALADRAQDPEARQSFGLLAQLFFALNLHHQHLAALEKFSDDGQHRSH